MGLGLYIYPRYAVHIHTGQTVPIERLRAHCLWHPLEGLLGQMVSGHVLYVSEALYEATIEGTLNAEDPDVEVERGEPGIAYRLAVPVRASSHASVEQLIRAVVERTRQALPPAKRKRLGPAPPPGTPGVLEQLELHLHQEGLHVLVPLLVGKRYQLFTDATEALVPVSPLVLRRTPRLCFALLSEDDLEDKRAGSPWLRQATELMVLPVNAARTPQAMHFVPELPRLKAVAQDEHLMGALAMALHEVAGGWPDLCDRFYQTLTLVQDADGLRRRLRELLELSRAAEAGECNRGAGALRDEDPAEALLALALGEGPEPAELRTGHKGSGSSSFGRGSGETHGPEARDERSATHDALAALLQGPREFLWDVHKQAYFEGLLGWDRGLAVPRSRVLELVLRGRQSDAGAAGRAVVVPVMPAGHGPPGQRVVRWLHVSDFHFSQKHGTAGSIVLESLLTTLTEMRGLGRTVDLIFVTGDIAFGGAPAEYAQAEAYLSRLCAAAGVSRAAVHMVPGNHDVFRAHGEGLERTIADPERAAHYFEPQTRRHHLSKLEHFRDFYNRFYDGAVPARVAAPGQATAGPERVQVREVQLGVLPLNTAWFAQDDQDYEKLLVGESVVRAGLADIAGAPIRVALLHHPLSYLSQVERKLVQERLSEGCNVLLRGHLHDTEAHLLVSPGQQMLSLAAGAAYQGRVHYQNRAILVELELFPAEGRAEVRPYPIRYELTGHDRWTLDTSVFPRSYPTYLATLPLKL